MHCLGCAMAHGETVGEAVFVHGNDMELSLKSLTKELNNCGTICSP